MRTGAFIQKYYLVESYIKKLKFVLKTISRPKFKEICKNLKPLQFNLLLSYIEASIELIPYGQNSGTLCPRDIKNSSFSCPWEILIQEDKGIALGTTREIIFKAFQEALKEIKLTSDNANVLFYNRTGLDILKMPKVDDVVQVLIPGPAKRTQLGKIIGLGKTTVEVLTSKGHKGKYNSDNVIFVSRPPAKTFEPFPKTQTSEKKYLQTKKIQVKFPFNQKGKKVLLQKKQEKSN